MGNGQKIEQSVASWALPIPRKLKMLTYCLESMISALIYNPKLHKSVDKATRRLMKNSEVITTMLTHFKPKLVELATSGKRIVLYIDAEKRRCLPLSIEDARCYQIDTCTIDYMRMYDPQTMLPIYCVLKNGSVISALVNLP
jgi:hypothetical protein